MFKIVSKRLLSPAITEMKVLAPRVAESALPGQFVIVRTDEFGERIPLTICDYDREEGTVTIVTQTIGISSAKINALNEGDSFLDFAGPLGRPSDLIEIVGTHGSCVRTEGAAGLSQGENSLSQGEKILNSPRILFVAGGVGTAPVYPQAKFLHEHGITPDVIIGAKTADLFTYVEEMKKVANVYLCTDDGSAGFHGMVPALMEDLIVNQGKKYDRCVIIGPMIMMKFATLKAKEHGLPAIVSLNALMVDGTGMCGACRVTVGGETRFTCVEGPEFDGWQVDFDEAMRRQNMYRNNPKTEKCNCHA
ncbi:MAG: sulfide/dihydroorotate dehydrogenase-like FAD/NAD-binding protein [Muribaculaceae bacterium]|nr:sulfide/dihydroorotate dehydrogenase-like FAD/NAD-binding protein [Muribaculaceae bacterium]